MTILSSITARNYSLKQQPFTPYWSDYKVYDSAWVISCENEHYQQRPNLILCYGDSWTWGDSLGTASWRKQIDDPLRMSLVYGRHIADHFDADFANSALPGMSNFWIVDRLSVLFDHDITRLSQLYKKIYIIVTLTELGRELDFDHYINEFKDFYQFDKDPNFSIEKCLAQSEEHLFKKIKHIQDHLPNNCQLVVGRNFTHTFDKNKNIVKHHLPKSWTDLLFEQQGFTYPTDVRIASFGSLSLDTFVKNYNLDNPEYKNWVINSLSVKMNAQVDLMTKSIYNNKIASKHPTDAGHKIWADYLCNYIESIV